MCRWSGIGRAGMLCALVVLAAAWAGGAGGAGARLEPFAAPALYSLETTVLLGEDARRGPEVGYKIKGRLHVAPVFAAPPHEYLLAFRLESPKLLQRTKHVNAEFTAVPSLWDDMGSSEFYGHWRQGVIETAYLPPDDLPDVLNYKKSLISLFQFQTEEGERNETDISGDCQVLYETVSNEAFRKIKRRCDSEAAWEGTLRWQRVTRYGVRGARLAGLWADELLRLGPAGLGLKARVLHSLGAEAGAAGGAGGPQRASLGAALGGLPAALSAAALRPALPALPALLEPEIMELEAALAEHRAALEGDEAGAGGHWAGGAALLALLPALRAAPAAALAALLQRPDTLPIRNGLARALGLAGTAAAVEAARGGLQLAGPEPLGPALTFLQAFALASQPQEEAVLEVLRLARSARDARCRGAAALAAGGAAGRAGERAAARVRDQLVHDLARCKDEECRDVMLHALGNMGRADTVELLLEHAGAGSLAALRGLARAPPAALTHARLTRLGAVGLRAALPLEARALALDLCARRRAAAPLPLAALLRALHDAGPRDAELLRALWQRLAALEPEHPELRAVLRRLPPALGGWEARAAAGTSSVLARPTGWAAGPWAARLDSLQVARGGLLRRGRVRLEARGPGGAEADLLEVELWTRGLEALGGAGAEAGAEREAGAEGVAGGLAFSVAGMRSLDISLFDGQAELLSHVWAGRGSADSGVVRAAWGARAAARLPLSCGAALHAHEARGALLALDARALVSLWWRSARGALALRAGPALAVRGALRAPWGRLEAEARAARDLRLRIDADLDFYDGVALCVRVDIPDHYVMHNVSLRWSQGGAEGGRGVRRGRATRRGAPGATLALGAPNDHVCRSLRAADDDNN